MSGNYYIWKLSLCAADPTCFLVCRRHHDAAKNVTKVAGLDLSSHNLVTCLDSQEAVVVLAKDSLIEG